MKAPPVLITEMKKEDEEWVKENKENKKKKENLGYKLRLTLIYTVD